MATLPIYEDPQTEFVSVREYLSTSYRPDCDYVDGRIEERNVGEFEHALLQTLLGQAFMNNRDAWGVLALQEQILMVVRRRRAHLQEQAIKLGKLIYRRLPDDFIEKMTVSATPVK